MGYSAYLIETNSRLELLERFPPQFPESIADHVTYRFPDDDFPPLVTMVRVVGYAKNHRLECVVIEIDGHIDRPSGGTFHVTLSIDREAGAKPVQSNHVLKQGWDRVEPFVITVQPTLI